MSNVFLGELLGTMTLILLGNGVCACVLLKGSFGENSGWLVITTGWGLAVLSGVLVALAIGSNAHINPAVTIGVSISSGDWSQAGIYISAQLIGAIFGASPRRKRSIPSRSKRHWRPTFMPRSLPSRSQR